jgi:hypothetical protein
MKRSRAIDLSLGFVVMLAGYTALSLRVYYR